MPVWTLLKASSFLCIYVTSRPPHQDMLEFVQSEERFTDVRDALKAFNKMDFDKLIASVPFTVMLIERTESIPSPQVGGMRDPCL